MTDVTITVRPNGSYRIEGPVRLIDSKGNQISTPQPAFSLCRCGHSKLKPFCDGAHKTCGFDGTEAHLVNLPTSEAKAADTSSS